MTARLLDQRDPKTGKYPFAYRPAAATDIALTFARIRREQREREVEEAQAANVRQIRKRAK